MKAGFIIKSDRFIIDALRLFPPYVVYIASSALNMFKSELFLLK